MKLPRVFVSHAGEDKDVCEELFSELERQGIPYFDYSKPADEERLGVEIMPQMRSELRKSDLVIAIVSAASTSPRKRVVMAEIHDALEQGFLARSMLVTVQLRVRDRSPTYWLRLPMAELQLKLARSPGSRLHFTPPAQREAFPVQLTGKVSLGGDFKSASCSPITALWYKDQIFIEEHRWSGILEAEEPLVRAGLAAMTKSWLGPFAELQGYVGYHLDWIERGCFSSLVKMLCERYQLTYKPPTPPDSKLPLHRHLHDEIWKMLPEFLRQLVLRQVESFEHNVLEGDWQECLLNIRTIKNFLNRQAGYKPYFPNIVEGLCLLRLGDGHGAKRTFEDCTLHEKADENAHGGLAKALYLLAQGERSPTVKASLYEQALISYVHGLELCKRNNDPAPFLRTDGLRVTGEILEEIQNGAIRPSQTLKDLLQMVEEDVEWLLKHDATGLKTEDRIKLRLVCAHWLKLRNHWAESLDCLDELLNTPLTIVNIPPACLDGFPDGLGSKFRNAVSDAGISLDDRSSKALGALCPKGDPQNFMLPVEQRAFRFRRVNDMIYEVYFVNAQAVLLRYEARVELASAAGLVDRASLEEAARELEFCSKDLDDPGVVRWVCEAWCRAGKEELALQYCQSAIQSYPDRPEILRDAAQLNLALGNVELGMKLAKQCAAACVELLASTDPNRLKSYPTPDVLYLWGQVQLFLGNVSSAEVAHDLAGGPDAFPWYESGDFSV